MLAVGERMKDYYKVLGVPRNATDAQIKQAYRKLVRACHPDVNSSPKAAEWTRALNEAYSVLGDAQRKTSYDMDVKSDESWRKAGRPGQTAPRQHRTASRTPPKTEPRYSHEPRNRTNSTLVASGCFVALWLLIWGFYALSAGSAGRSAGQQQTSGMTTLQRPAYLPLRSQSTLWQNTRPIEPAFTEPELPAPGQGWLDASESTVAGGYNGATAPLKISTREWDGNYVVKISEWNSGKFVGSAFIRRGSTLDVKLPLGSYQLKFARGDKWYGTKHLFGPTTAYSHILEKLVFYRSGSYTSGHEIELIPQVGGKLAPAPMTAEDW